MKKKIKGFMLLPAVLMSILLGLLALSFLQIFSGQFSALSANRIALQASQFAQSEADFLRNLEYDSVVSAAHARSDIPNVTGWQSQVSIGDETTENEVQQRLATISIFRNSTIATPDFSLQVPLSSASSGSDKFPVGTILPYVGDIKDIPKGWALCDGTNNTPDLTGRFLEGVTANPKIFKDAGIPNITGSYSTGAFGSGGPNNRIIGAIYTYHYSTGNWVNGGNSCYYHAFNIDASRCSPVYRNDITTVQPSSYTVYYIMKIKK